MPRVIEVKVSERLDDVSMGLKDASGGGVMFDPLTGESTRAETL